MRFAENSPRFIPCELIVSRARELRLCRCSVQHLMRKLFKLEAFGEAFPGLDHHLRLFLVLAAGDATSVLYLLPCWEDFVIGRSHLHTAIEGTLIRAVHLSDELVGLVDFARHLDHHGLLFELLDLQELLIDLHPFLLLVAQRIGCNLVHLLLVESEQLVGAVEPEACVSCFHLWLLLLLRLLV